MKNSHSSNTKRSVLPSIIGSSVVIAVIKKIDKSNVIISFLFLKRLFFFPQRLFFDFFSERLFCLFEFLLSTYFDRVVFQCFLFNNNCTHTLSFCFSLSLSLFLLMMPFSSILASHIYAFIALILAWNDEENIRNEGFYYHFCHVFIFCQRVNSVWIPPE